MPHTLPSLCSLCHALSLPPSQPPPHFYPCQNATNEIIVIEQVGFQQLMLWVQKTFWWESLKHTQCERKITGLDQGYMLWPGIYVNKNIKTVVIMLEKRSCRDTYNKAVSQGKQCVVFLNPTVCSVTLVEHYLFIPLITWWIEILSHARLSTAGNRGLL